MAVMENIRAGANNPWMKAVFAAIVLVFVFWGVGGAGGPTNQVIAEVNGDRITDTQFQRLMRNYSRSQGEAKSDEDQSRIAAQAVSELIETLVLQQTATDNNIEVSDDEIARYVLQIDAFRDGDGKFSDKLYKTNLKRMGLTQGRFEGQVRDQLTLTKLSELAWSGVRISDEQVRRLYMQTQTQIALKMVRIPDSMLLDDVVVDEAAIETYVTTNEADIRVRYEADFKRLYKKPQRARLRQIIIKSDGDTDPRSRMDTVVAEAKSGADFAQLAKEYSQDLSAAGGGDVGLMAAEQLSPSVAAAVFSTEVGGITDVITVSEGLLIAKVEARFEAEVTPFDDVKLDIARAITAEKGVGTAAAAYADKLLAQWTADGAPSVETLAEQSVVALDTPPFPVGNPNFPGLSDSPALIKAISTAAAPGLIGEVFPVPGGRIIAELTLFEKPDEAKFESEKSLVRLGLEAEARKQWLGAWRADLVDQADIVQYWRP
jgi:peptidyl-prolyl cis-trans isomerase D